jgi:hypothetical protein
VLIVRNKPFMLNVVMLSVVIQKVMAPVPWSIILSYPLGETYSLYIFKELTVSVCKKLLS